MAFTPEHAGFAVLGFFGTAGLFICFAVVFLIAVLTKRKRIGIGAAGLTGILVCGYALMLLGVSLTGHEKTIPPGDWKYFCEVDCHIAYSIGDVKTLAARADERQQAASPRHFVLVQLRVWFDPKTISPHRGNGPLMTSPRRIALVDNASREYPRSPDAEAAAARLFGAAAPLEQPLRPGESFNTSFGFDVPAGTSGLRLLVTDSPDDWLSRVIIGHEDSFLHPKIYLALTPTPESRPSAQSLAPI